MFYYINSEKSYWFLLRDAYNALNKSIDGKISMQLDSEETIWTFLEYVSKYLTNKNKKVLSKDAFDMCIKGTITSITRSLKTRWEVEFFTKEEKEEIKKTQKKRVGRVKKVNFVKEANSFTNDEGEEVSKLELIPTTSSTSFITWLDFDLIEEKVYEVFTLEEAQVFTYIFREGGSVEDEKYLGMSNTKAKRIYNEIVKYIIDNKENFFPDYKTTLSYNEIVEKKKKYEQEKEEMNELSNREHLENSIESIDTQVFIEECILCSLEEETNEIL